MNADISTLWTTMRNLRDDLHSLAADTFLTADEDCLICKVNGCQDHLPGCLGGQIEQLTEEVEALCTRIQSQYGLPQDRQLLS